MAKKYLGVTLDIHMGGVEHIPVHHTNEIAQSEAANGVPFVHFWLHNEHLVINQEKMAKSQGTGLSVAELIEKSIDPLALRYFYLTAHYRTRQNFTWEALQGAQNALNELRAQVSSIRNHVSRRTTLSQEKLTKVDEIRNRFDEALARDLNTPQALAVVWEVVKSNIPSQDKYDLLLDFDEVLGLKLSEGSGEVPEDIRLLGGQIDTLRREEKYKEADVVREELKRKGYAVETTPDGTVISKR